MADGQAMAKGQESLQVLIGGRFWGRTFIETLVGATVIFEDGDFSSGRNRMPKQNPMSILNMRVSKTPGTLYGTQNKWIPHVRTQNRTPDFFETPRATRLKF